MMANQIESDDHNASHWFASGLTARGIPRVDCKTITVVSDGKNRQGRKPIGHIRDN